MATRIEYGMLDENGDLVLIPTPDNYLKPTVKDLTWLTKLFGEQTKYAKVTIEDVTFQPGGETA